ncbi:MAG: hypothetical protein V4564_23225 [Pseudomonadota bacterium]|uniref:hypothetical protein n=1 Tax=Sphingomonas sp. ERG5 TaxID=1381597 RepID=UPI000A3FF184|nr:hypothetical protein [Sphingomonas sp. ERG5]
MIIDDTATDTMVLALRPWTTPRIVYQAQAAEDTLADTAQPPNDLSGSPAFLAS